MSRHGSQRSREEAELAGSSSRRRATRAPRAMAAPTRGAMRKRDRDADAAVETPRDSKRRRTVAFHATVARVVGRADPEVDRTPFGEPPRCGGCGLHCLGRRYGCVRCHADAFCLCVVCFSAHVRMSAPDEPDAPPENHQRRDHASSPSSSSSPSARPSFPDGDIRRDVADILRAAREQAAAARAAQDEDEDEDDEMEETCDDGDWDGDGDAFATDDGGAADGSSGGVHVHPPEDFRREGDGDQEAMDEMMREKRAFAEERERDAAEAAERSNADADETADVELAASRDGTSRVIVVDPGGSADKKAADSSKPGLVSRGGISTWDYASEII